MVICVMGESGSGKTTACRTLPPDETFYLDCDGKGLSWKGWRDQYNSNKKNYKRTDDPIMVKGIMDGVNSKCPNIHYLVVDTLNGIMVGDEMRRINEKGYDKWQDLASSVYNIVDGANSYRDDLTVIFLAHSETIKDDDGYQWTHLKTNGKKLNKIVLESKFTTVLLAKQSNGEYVLETRNPNSTAKTPMGAFDDDVIPNDIMAVITALKEF